MGPSVCVEARGTKLHTIENRIKKAAVVLSHFALLCNFIILLQKGLKGVSG
jgi:hypothetical protein